MAGGHVDAVRTLLAAGANCAYKGCTDEDVHVTVEEAAKAAVAARPAPAGREILALVSGALALTGGGSGSSAAGTACAAAPRVGAAATAAPQRRRTPPMARGGGRAGAPGAADDAAWATRMVGGGGKTFVYNEATGQVAWEAPTVQWAARASRSRKR